MFKLVISDDEGKQTVVPLVRDEVTIGRKEGNTIRLTERNVSRRHARLVKANGAFMVEDLHSYNGVRVNGQRIGAEIKLDAGDQITIGDYQLALQVEAAEAPSVADADTALLAAPGPPARLVMITPPAPGAEFALTAERTRIGRAEDLDVWVNHRSISREHAEIQKEPDGGLRLIDLGSANGVRVNDQDVQNALLEPGDVVELGQVRFRFVAAGEHYVFDADRTVQMSAVTIEPAAGMGNRLPILVGVAIILLAIIGAVIVASLGDSSVPEARPLAENDPAEVGETHDDRYRASISACNAAVGAGDVTAALAAAGQALELRPADEAARGCQTQATELRTQEETFRRGVDLFDQGDLRAAYQQFDSLPEDSPLRARTEVSRAIRSYANMRLTEARDAVESDPTEAIQIAAFVSAMIGLTPQIQADAAQIRADAEARGGDEPEVAVAEATPTPVRDRPGGRGRRQGRSGARPSSQNGGGGNTTAAATPNTGGGGTGSHSGTSSSSAPSASLTEQSRQCSMQGDNNCVIRLLDGHARNPVQLAMLIEAYRARGQSERARRHMETLVQRFPGSSQARMYRQILSRQ